MSYITAKSLDTFRALALDTCPALNDQRVENLLGALVATRQSARISFAVMKRFLEKLGKYDANVAREAVDRYLERGLGNEAYLLGIARGIAKENGQQNGGRFRHGTPEPEPALPRLPEPREHLNAVLSMLRDMYGAPDAPRDALRAAGAAYKTLCDEAPALDARTIDARAEKIEAELRAAAPDLAVPHFSPWWV